MGHREPNRDDLLSALASSKTVKPEAMHDVEIGYAGDYTGSNVPSLLNVNFYLMQYKDQLVLTGKLNDVGSPIKENVPVSYRAGIELTGSIKLNRAMSLGRTTTPPTYNGEHQEWRENLRRTVFAFNYSFAYSINKIKSFDEYIYTYDDYYTPVDSLTQIVTHKNTNISFSPNIVASLELVGYPVEGLEIALMNKAVSKQYLDNTSNENRKIKAFYYSNIRLSYKLPLKRDDKEIKFTLLLNNIFNYKYVSNGYSYSERYYSGGATTDTYTYNYYYPQAGFNVLGGVSVRF
jgi:iron complex outermembrane receptor protein